MNRIFASSVISVLVLAGCATQSQPEPEQELAQNPICMEKGLPDGWSTSSITPEVMRAMDTILGQMNTESPVKQVNQVRTQVVSGMNYAIEFTLENGEVWHAVVNRNLRDDYMIERIAKPGPLCP
ncbi:cystatin domain-containing protein [Vibrio coralliilyticus]|uniref:cystatin domain-containing protein n=1 Tax=Vibrio coralliilyticus TaxID=190893 RepID=UPI0015606891|nr:cystatin domain-containing protein [Vibrio coralliilyticus]NRF28844.1 2-oxoglutarate dehydrogenase [Vibrio coralliilyticus]NRF50905.1 2-oxoglutarate dehydrogenase [Vibrio coralliilyticus]NRG02385.1 2-oxoglutarate dehydrogenase [Vibrio coralliilyticus]